MSKQQYLLDTSVVVEILRGMRQITDFVPNENESVIYLCNIVAGELLYGAIRSAQPEAQRLRVLAFLRAYPLIPSNTAVAEAYARLKRALENAGQRIPDNDL